MNVVGEARLLNHLLQILFLTGFVASSLIRAPYTRPRQGTWVVENRATALDRSLMLLTFVGTFLVPLVYVLTGWLDFANYSLPPWAGGFGIAVFVAGLWLFWRAHTDLGRNWFLSLQIREDHELVTDGVFRYIRHPMYASMWLWSLAQTLLLQNWVAGWSGLACVLPTVLLRVPQEEKMMLDHFGEAYRSYMRRTGRVFPRFIHSKRRDKTDAV